MKLTEWFEPTQKPDLKGVYETDSGDGILGYQYWNGVRWGSWGYDVNDAMSEFRMKSFFQNVYWRGLAEDPKKTRKKAPK